VQDFSFVLFFFFVFFVLSPRAHACTFSAAVTIAALDSALHPGSE